MSQYIVVHGYVTSKSSGTLRVLTLDGVEFELSEKDVLQSYPLDTSKDGARRMFVEPNANIKVTFTASQLFRTGTRLRAGDTTYKYYDDGGTISKSRDDDPKDPWSDNPPPPKDPTSDQSRR